MSSYVPRAGITKKLIISFVILLLIIAGFLMFFNSTTKDLNNSIYWTDHAKSVLQNAEHLNFKVTEIVGESRSYAITGNPRYIDSFASSRIHLSHNIEHLKELVRNNPSQRKSMARLEPLLNARVDFAEAVIIKRKNFGFDSARIYIKSGRGSLLTDSIKRIIYDIQKEEAKILANRQSESKMHGERTEISLYILQVLLILTLILTGITIIRAFRARDRAEEELTESKEWFAKTLNSIGDGVVATNAEGEITFMNPAAQELTGCPFEESKGQQLGKIFQIVNEDTRASVENPALIAIKEKKPVLLANHTLLIKKDNSEIAISDSAAPIFNSGGDLVGVVLVFRNVEYERKAEKELKQARDRFLMIFDLSPVALTITTLSDGKFLYTNHAFSKLFLKEGENIIGKTLTEINMLTPEERAKWIEHLQSPKGKEPAEIKLRATTGKDIYTLVKREVMEIDGQQCALTALADISERINKERQVENLNKELEKNIEQQKSLNKELESFSYSVSHDLRAPLRSIDGYTRILLEDYGTKLDEEAHRLMNTVMNNAQKMNRLIDDLLRFSRLGKQEIEKVELDMNVIFNSIINETKGHGPGQKTEFEVKPLPPAKGDRNLITQVIINLISNAVKYSSKKENPHVEVGSYTKDGENVYYIKDNGAGFDMAHADKLFGIFQRLHSPSEFEGTGVGLAIVQRIINKHRGKVWAEAIPEKGATFYFSLPLN